VLNKACPFSSQTFQLEGEATGRAIKLAKFVNTPLYVVHVMSIDALDEVSRARHSGKCGEEEYRCMSWLAIACLYHQLIIYRNNSLSSFSFPFLFFAVLHRNKLYFSWSLQHIAMDFMLFAIVEDSTMK
jgi:hypothetical protein